MLMVVVVRTVGVDRLEASARGARVWSDAGQG